jgi:hypothetical protein
MATGRLTRKQKDLSRRICQVSNRMVELRTQYINLDVKLNALKQQRELLINNEGIDDLRNQM